MTEDKAYQFSSFKFDPSAGRLWKGSEFRPIRRKTFALLEYLLANSGRLVTREDLLAAVWPEVNINEEGLTMCVHEAREALDDSPQSPRFIETVHGRGYRFMVPVTTIDAQEDPPPPLLTTLNPENSIVVGREAESARLRQSWQRAISGKRQVLFISGEAGIGKTTIVDSLLGAIQESGEALIGRGQCLERYGQGEAYVPIFEALGQLCRGRQGKDVRQILLDRAPSWTMHMPEVFGSADAKPDRVNKAAAATSGRMMREIATALELLAALRPVMLICEDLHLGDRPSTVELIAYLARRRESARLFILGTYRTAEVQQDPNPMRQILHELRTHKECEELELKGLGKDAIAEYLRRRTPNAAIPETLVEQMYQRTGGNALFMASIADHLEARMPTGNGASPWPKDLRESGVPDNIRELIERQLERLSDGDQKLLRAASVAAAEAREFSAAALCAALYDDGGASAQDVVEEQCAALTHSTHFLRAAEIARWPDGTIAASYLFPHALYQEVAYGLATPGFRARAHLRIGERLEAAFGTQAARIAAELALHFERGGDNRRAVKHAHAAASGAIARSANREAIAYVEKGLQLLKTLPRDSEGLQAEIDLETRRATALLDVAGFAAPELRQSHQRIIELVAELGQSPAQVFLAQGSARYVTAPKNLIEARALLEKSLELAHSNGDRVVEQISQMLLAFLLYELGDFSRALALAEGVMHNTDLESGDSYSPKLDKLSYVAASAHTGMCLWALGYPEQAVKRVVEAVAMVQELPYAPTSIAPTLLLALLAAATLHGQCGDWQAVQSMADKVVALTTGKDLEMWLAWGVFFRGAVQARLGNIADGGNLMREGMMVLEATGAAAVQPSMLAYLRELVPHLMPIDKAQELVAKTIEDAADSGESLALSELHRTMALLKLKATGRKPSRKVQAGAEESLLKAIDIARQQKAKSFELRAAMDLARLWRERGQKAQAYELLSPIYGWFKEGFETIDLKEAETLIEELS